MKISTLKIENDGVWVNPRGFPPDVRLKIRDRDCREAARLQTRVMFDAARPVTADEKATRALAVRDVQVTQALLVDVEGLEGDDGKPLTVDEVRVLLLDPDYEVLVQAIDDEANRLMLARLSNIEASTKKS